MVVVGGGVAGLSAALLAASQARVLVVSRGELDDGCTALAQGGIAAAVGPDDSPELHLQDTLAAGRGLCDEFAVRLMVEEAPARVADLAAWGVAFDREGDRPDLHREAAHSRARVLHAGGDATGAAIESALVRRLGESSASVLAHHTVTHVLCSDADGCVGVEVCDPGSGSRTRVGARAVILASGGAAALWSHTTNPAGATGDGIALAYEAGADVADLEFIQFHPTVLAVAGAPAFLISEAVRGEGARIVDSRGRRFLLDSDPQGELAPRDVVARAIWEEMEQSGEPVFLDCRGLGDRLAERFPTIVATCRRHGVDPATQPIPISPAAHYTIGGVVTGLDGATTLPGLYACGEVARTGVHGANRLASNSLLEGVVYGRRAALTAVAAIPGRPPGSVTELSAVAAEGPLAGAGAAGEPELRDLMWSACGISRTGPGLGAALAAIDRMGEGDRDEQGGDGSWLGRRRRQLARTAAGLIVEAALNREESRGAHHRGDFPTSIDRWSVSHAMRQQRGVHLVRDPAARH